MHYVITYNLVKIFDITSTLFPGIIISSIEIDDKMIDFIVDKFVPNSDDSKQKTASFFFLCC